MVHVFNSPLWCLVLKWNGSLDCSEMKWLFLCAEKAFFDQSLLELLYFPEDQKWVRKTFFSCNCFCFVLGGVCSSSSFSSVSVEDEVTLNLCVHVCHLLLCYCPLAFLTCYVHCCSLFQVPCPGLLPTFLCYCPLVFLTCYVQCCICSCCCICSFANMSSVLELDWIHKHSWWQDHFWHVYVSGKKWGEHKLCSKSEMLKHCL